MAVVEHPEVAHPVMYGPERLGLNGARRQSHDDGADLALVLLAGFAVDEAGNAKGEEQMVFIEKVERNETVALAKINGARSGKAQGINGKRQNWWKRWLVGKALGKRVAFDDAGYLGRVGHTALCA
jgi:hypothetical protein